MGSSSPVKIYFTSKLKSCFVNISPLLAKDWSNIWKVSEYYFGKVSLLFIETKKVC